MSGNSSDKVLVVADGGSPIERISSLIEQQTDIQLKILTKMNTCPAVVDNVSSVPCVPAKSLVGKVQIRKSELNELAAHMVRGTTRMVAKTIYNFHNKTKEQITEILLNEEREFIKANPDYQYDNYRYEDGKHGERTIILIFKHK